MVYLIAAVLLTSGGAYGDRLAILTQQHKERAAARHLEALTGCVSALQTNREVYPAWPLCSKSRPEECAGPVDARHQWIVTHNKWCVQLESDSRVD